MKKPHASAARAARPKSAIEATNREPLLLGALLVLALALRFHGLGWGLPEVYEEAIPLKKAWSMWGWGPDRTFDPNPHFFKYPSLTLYLQFIGQAVLYLALRVAGAIHSSLDFRILYQMDKTPFYLLGRSITALFGAATVLPTFHLAKRAGGLAAALPAALLVAINTPLIDKSQVVEVDVPLTFLVATGCLLCLRLAEAPTARNALLAGIATGLATACKYPGLFLALPGFAAILLSARARAAPARPDRGPKILALAGLFLLGIVVATFAASPYVFLDARSAWRDLGAEREHMRLGHFGSDQGRAWLAYAQGWCSRLVGWPLGLASALGVVAFAGVWRRTWAVILASLFLPLVAVVGSWSMKADRYLFPLIPLGIVFATALAARWAKPASAPAAPARERAILAIATAAFAVPALAWFPQHLRNLAPDPRTQARAWVEANLPVGAFLAVEQYGPNVINPLELQAWDRELAGALRARGYQPRLYAVQSMPMFQVRPERSARFYHLGVYDAADYVVVTGAVRDRYREDPARFQPQLAFYDSLERRFARVKEFRSGGGPGTDVVIYRNPAHDRTFAARVPGPVPDLETLAPARPTGGEQFFYFNFGINHEAFGFLNHAIACYQEGLRYPSADPGLYTQIAQRVVHCLVRQQRAKEAVAFLDSALARAPTPIEAARLRQTRERIAAQ